MSKLYELLTEMAKRDFCPEINLTVYGLCFEGTAACIRFDDNAESVLIEAEDEAGLIAKLQEYLLKEKNQ
jgi:hypothetical protein